MLVRAAREDLTKKLSCEYKCEGCIRDLVMRTWQGGAAGRAAENHPR